MVELGDLYSQEVRKVLMKFKIPTLASLGLARIATRARLRRAAEAGRTGRVLADQRQRRPGDEAAGRVRHPTVNSEVLSRRRRRQTARVRVFEHGQFDEGQRLIGETKSRLSASLQAAPSAEARDPGRDRRGRQMDQISFEMGVGSAR